MHFSDTHSHLNMMVKKNFDRPLTEEELEEAEKIILQAKNYNVKTIINVGTSLIESENCIALADRYEPIYAAVGIHPNDITPTWKKDFEKISSYCNNHKKNKIVALGETGLDFHYPNFSIETQKEVFKKHIELSLEHNLALIIHSRDAQEETISFLEQFSSYPLRGTIHCFSYDLDFAERAIALGFVLGIGGTITYPKNQILRSVIETLGVECSILETDAPFLPVQTHRGKQNHPLFIHEIAAFLANLIHKPIEEIAKITEENVQKIFFQNNKFETLPETIRIKSL